MPIYVKISKGVHTINIPRNMNKLIKAMFTEPGITSARLKVSLGERIRGSASCQGINGIKLGAYDPSTNSFTAKLQPESNDGRHRCTITISKESNQDPLEIYNKLSARYSKDNQQSDNLASTEIGEDLLAENEKSDSADEANDTTSEDIMTKTTASNRKPGVWQVMSNQVTVEVLEQIYKTFYQKEDTETFELSTENWIDKNSLLRSIRSLDLGIPENQTIGYLLRQGYLQKNSENPEKQCRLSNDGLEKIGRLETKKHVPEIYLQFKLLEQMSLEYNHIVDSVQPIKDEIITIDAEIQALEVTLNEKKMRQIELQQQIDMIMEQINPAQSSAHERWLKIQEIINHPLP